MTTAILEEAQEIADAASTPRIPVRAGPQGARKVLGTL